MNRYAVVVVVLALGVGCLAQESDSLVDRGLPEEKNAVSGGIVWRKGTRRTVEEGDKKPCCLPTKWQSAFVVAGESSGGRSRRPTGFLAHAHAYFDLAGKRAAVHEFVMTARRRMNVSMLVTGGKVYFYGGAGKKARCKSMKLKKPLHRTCVHNATLHGTVTLGPAVGGLKTNVWMFHRKTKKGSVGGVCYVTPRCVPVLAEMGANTRGRKGGPEEEVEHEEDRLNFRDVHRMRKPRPKPSRGGRHTGATITYSDFKTSISDTKVFNIPKICKKAEPISEEELEQHMSAAAQGFNMHHDLI